MEQLLWVVYPYAALLIMIVGCLYRYAHNQMSWGSRSSELLEKRWLKWGSLLFHWGILMVVGGHVMGLLIPLGLYAALGVPAEMYHVGADVLGGIAGLMTWAGLLILLVRRFGNARVRRNSSISDFVVLILLFVIVSSGNFPTIVTNNLVGPYEYRATVGPWLRGLLTLHPDAAIMVGVPLGLQIHVLLTFLLFVATPFTRLVHIWSLPLAYVRRAPIQYRDREQYRVSQLPG